MSEETIKKWENITHLSNGLILTHRFDIEEFLVNIYGKKIRRTFTKDVYTSPVAYDSNKSEEEDQE